ncbi:hypothetical protein ABBQ38_004182 [Trebouxia sp. C0009 RCD-2024]
MSHQVTQTKADSPCWQQLQKGKGLWLLSLPADDLPQSLKDVIRQDQLPVVQHTIHIGYDQMSADEVIRRVVPEGIQEVTHAFESIGHIAHLNLRDALLPYKHIIGQVILDKNPAIKTVVNKVGNIENEFRVFQMDVVAGEPHLETEVKQHSARFKLDYSQVYWNSRLETEHKRLVDTFKAGQVVVDVMAGIGPFAIPAAQKGCKVLANDLNPISYKYLQQNITLNKVQKNVTAFNMDGRAFIRQQCDLAQPAAGPQTPKGADPAQPQETPDQTGCQGPSISSVNAVAFDHVIMNLPVSAIEFLDAFRGAFDRAAWEGPLPCVHCYCFQRKDETQADIQHRVEQALGGSLDSRMRIHEVRLVAPNKKMLCLTFCIPPDVAFATLPEMLKVNAAGELNPADDNAEQLTKRQRTLL